MQTTLFSASRRHRRIAAGAVAATALASILGLSATRSDDSTTVEAAGAGDVSVAADPFDEVAAQRAARRAGTRTTDVAGSVADTLADADEAAVVAANETAVEPAAEPTVAPEPEPEPEPAATSHWDQLADCESGDWDANGSPIAGSARWDYGIAFSHGDIFEGGLNFHPGTWDSYRLDGMPEHAGQASRSDQITVAEQVLADQGWGAWPVCSSKIGLR